jgi:hypothetical protein
MTRAALALIVVIGATASLMWWLRGSRQADPSYVPQVESPTWSTDAPVVAIDDAHWNLYSANRGYAPFARLLTADGYRLIEGGNAGDEKILEAVRIVVVSDALGLRGVIRHVGQLVGLHLEGLGADAFTDAEANRIERWVRDGGSLLLAADHAPAGRAVQSLAERFGVRLSDGFVVDPEQSEPGSPSFIVFQRQTRTLAPHPIIDGRSKDEAINRVVTFAGQAIDGPPHAAKLLMFSGTAYQTTRPGGNPEGRQSAAGLGQALAMTHGNGRVVVVGEAALLTSLLLNKGEMTQRIGLAWPNADNERFVRHIMRWLSHAAD